MISSDIVHSLNKILPRTQNLLPVSFKRKLQYRGYFIEEIVDRVKIHAYFNFLKEYNHLYKDFTFDHESLSNFQQNIVKGVETDSDSSDSEDEQSGCEQGKAIFSVASLITDKY